MAKKEEKIKFNDLNYAIYKIGSWKNSYEVNLIGNSNEIPQSQVTKNHVEMSMTEIRKSSFEIENKVVNGIVALGYQLNPNLKKIAIDDLIKKEEEEYNNIIEELESLKLEDNEKTIDLNENDYLIYKLEKDHHVTIAKPTNEFTQAHHLKEIEKLAKQSTK
ncbi:hypothetical protein [Methanobrevibacter curvatus]|uniref:Uncharacterized protein n=1 Tax=Methanobrevibacter curvatus TaxID=49547 RepID=A0A166CC81_9EURY|nr:hypothetical protein [Methanobrevibacter curvatus]KZX14358.1 hypothetical protein MBCUR_05820 [Methanobrevibacter curvatus]